MKFPEWKYEYQMENNVEKVRVSTVEYHWPSENKIRLFQVID